MAQEAIAMVDKSHLSTKKKSRKVLEQSVQNIIALAKETGNKIQSAVAEKMETFGLNVITSQAKGYELRTVKYLFFKTTFLSELWS